MSTYIQLQFAICNLQIAQGGETIYLSENVTPILMACGQIFTAIKQFKRGLELRDKHNL